jgi:hypothetical protein
MGGRLPLLAHRGPAAMRWSLSFRADQEARLIADRHYNRQKVGAAQFVPPGRCMVLKTPAALWVTSWPFAEYVKHAWAGAWVNSLFRNESRADLSSQLIREAVAATRWFWSHDPSWRVQPEPAGMVTFVDATKVRVKTRNGRVLRPGQCYRKAGFVDAGETKGGLIALWLPLGAMPAAAAPHGSQAELGMTPIVAREKESNA